MEKLIGLDKAWPGQCNLGCESPGAPFQLQFCEGRLENVISDPDKVL